MTPKRIYIDFGTPIEAWTDENKGVIMDSIYLNVFDFLESEERDRVVLQVTPKKPERITRATMFKEPPFNVDFIISKEDINQTLNKMLEYYIEVEEYEKCAKIHKLQTAKKAKKVVKKQKFW